MRNSPQGAPAPHAAADAPAAAVAPSVVQVALLGVLSLALAMGVGRFAFTPMLPLMMRDGQLDTAAGALWAAANYAGYLAGAWTAARFGAQPLRGLRLGLAGVAATTLALALPPPWLGSATGAALRAASGVFSAWVLVCASSWCLAELARRQRSAVGAWVYTGVGLGIALTGVLAWLGGRQPSSRLWLELGAVAALGAAWVHRQLPASAAGATPGAAPAAAPATAATPAGGTWGLVLCYAGFGFGYIVPATFLPAMARQQAADPLVFGLTWPLFGSAAVLSVALAARFLGGWPRRRLWACAQALMALGTALPLASRSLGALALSALFVGGTFMVTTMAGLQLARERQPDNPTPLLARLSVAFASGQIAGPLLVRTLDQVRPWGLDALDGCHALATLVLLASAAWLARGAAASTGR